MWYVDHSCAVWQWSLPTTVDTCHKQAVLCELCTKMCWSLQNSHRFVKAHTVLSHPVSVCAICKQSMCMSNKACVCQLLQCTAVFDWCKRFKDRRSSTGDLAHSCHPPHITDPDTHAKVHWMVQCHRAMLHHIGELPAISVECVHYIAMHNLV
jgi:hypothetical protein